MKSEITENLMCEFGDLIVPYLYGETSEAEGERFETHLVDCVPCTDEFAGLSFSRYSVFEWQKQEFATMPTPQIVIPYETRQAETAGFFAGFRELLTFNWATAVGAAAVLVAVVGLGFVAINYFGKADQQLAVVDETNKNVQIVRPAASPITPVAAGKVETIAKSPVETPDRSPQPVKAVSVTPRPRQTTTALNKGPKPIRDEPVPAPQRQVRKSPSLTAEADDDDRSLRLTDLFDTIDTRL